MEKVKIILKDSSSREVEKGTASYEIAKSLSRSLAGKVLAVKINGKVREISCPVTEESNVEFLTFDDKEGKEVYWHSTSHLMAHAIELLFPGAKFGVGPAIENGFYYDIDVSRQLTEDDLRKIEEKMHELSQAKNEFKRCELSKDDALEFFRLKDDQYKLEIISELNAESEAISLYKEGDFTDLCRGPHLSDTSKIKHFRLLSVSGSYWRGDEHNKRMQRIYGISFPEKKMLDEYVNFLEEAKKRDHRKLGRELDLFSIHEEAGPGLIYWHPKGARIRNAIESFWKDAHFANGYEMLYTPHMGKSWLWETSGHLGHYKDSMFAPMTIDDQNYYIKPMNCPFHIMIYKDDLRSYRDLPLRWAELGTVYRYEKSGVLHGLLRVRGFTQDDAHIFCAQDQIESEIIEVIRFSKYMWKSFGFESLKFYLSTKPASGVGDDENWAKASDVLKKAMEHESIEYFVDEGGGAFYGPKIDIKIKDALSREWQMSTIQFDFNLPERFDLKYIGEDGKEHRPYMVHRALLGSIERFMGVLIEHFAGAFPLWLAPVQVAVIPVSEGNQDYSETIYNALKDKGIRCQMDRRNEKIGYKIRDWETQKVPYMIVAGEKEKAEGNISVRQHKKGDIGKMSLQDFITKLNDEIVNKTIIK